MKKVFKKFLGAMAVFSIFTGSVGIGASAYKFNAVPVASVPGMTDEEVKAMNLMAEFVLFFNEMLSTDESQWSRNLSRAQKLYRNIKNFKPAKDIRWEENFYKHENWRRVNPIFTKVTHKDFNISHDKEVRINKWFEKNIASIL